jgi:hypothetical protein
MLKQVQHDDEMDEGPGNQFSGPLLLRCSMRLTSLRRSPKARVPWRGCPESWRFSLAKTGGIAWLQKIPRRMATAQKTLGSIR